MTKAEQTIEARMMQIREMVREGATEMTGKTYRDASGKIAGRFGGGFTKMFPELERAGMSPGEAAKAIELGKGRRFNRLKKSIAIELSLSLEKRKRGRPSVAPHAGNRKCRHCQELHTTGEHRFHGEGSYHRTHLFSFNPMKNPNERVVIYGRVLRIEAQKTQAHRCDEECRDYKHRYFHEFKPGAVMYGLPDGSILIKAK